MKNFEKKRGGSQLNFLDEIIVDNFAGGGGASTGMELATGRPVAIAINHDPDAILMHRTNHPYTEHLQASVWDVDPREVCRGRPVGLAWFSPDCKHFSKAKGAALVDRNIRGLAWIVLRWAGTVRPRVIILENVEEFVTWGPVRKGKPVKKKAGQTFQKWKRQLLELGYQVEHREIVAADLGAPTTRKRFVLVARCDGRPIVWPERTHGPRDSEEVRDGRLMPWKSAAEIIDWSVPCYSVFASKRELKEKYGVNAVRPLADNTMRRVIRGVDKFTIRSGHPFIVECNHESGTAANIMSIRPGLDTDGAGAMGRGEVVGLYYREQKHICGKDYDTAPYMEVDLYPVSAKKHKASRRAKKKEASSLAQQTYNDKRAKRYHVQLVNTNFGKGDFSWTGTYDDDHLPEPGDTHRADLDFTNYIKRLYRWCDRNGVQRPKWVAATEYTTITEDGKVCGRHHHHAIIQHTEGLTRDVLEELWSVNGKRIGLTRGEYLDVDHGSVESLVRYISKNKRCARSWRQSRGLEKPKTPPPNDSKWSRRKLDEASTLYIDDTEFWEKKYPGYTLNRVETKVSDGGMRHTIVILRRAECWHGRGNIKQTRRRPV